MAGVLDYYGYEESNTALVSSKTIDEQKQVEKDKSQDEMIKKNLEDNEAQQVKIDRNSSINAIQEGQITDLYNLIGHGASGTTTVVYAVDSNFKVEANTGLTEYIVAYETTYEDKPVSPKACKVTKYVNDNPGKVILENSNVSGTTVTSNIEGNKERYVLEVTPDASIAFKSKSEVTRYVFYVGSISGDTISSEDIEKLDKHIGDGERLIVKENSSNGQYMWFVIPDSLNVQSITSEGIDVKLSDNVQDLSNDLGNFKCYRSNKLLTSANWNIIIDTSEK